MSWITKLCNVYDAMIEKPGCGIVPVGLIEKEIGINIVLDKNGNFSHAQKLPKEESLFTVPTTIQAEGRSSSKIAPFPLAEQIKYLVVADNEENPCFEAYYRQLYEWSKSPGAPECLKVLCGYLKKGTLFSDLMNEKGLEFKWDTKSDDKKTMACFSVECCDGESRLWMRDDVRQSWLRYRETFTPPEKGLCYAEGRELPIAEMHPKLYGNLKLISGKDDVYPFRYKGRFTEDHSSVLVNDTASIKAHNALRWLIEKQGFKRYGIYFVAWNTCSPELDSSGPDFTNEKGEKTEPDTFETYAIALRNATVGLSRTLEKFSDDKLADKAILRKNEVVIMGLQAATTGRISVVYYQEIPGNEYVERVNNWIANSTWVFPGKEKIPRSPTWYEICEAVMGRDETAAAKKDPGAEKSGTKFMRGIQLQLLSCTIDGSPLPDNFVWQAFNRAVNPLAFTRVKDGTWNSFAWAKSIAAANALIRKKRSQFGKTDISTSLDRSCRDRDYLFGRLAAAAHKAEADVCGENAITWAVRLFRRFVQTPCAAWQELFCKLLPYLKKLKKTATNGDVGYSADWYLRLFGEIERLFDEKDRNDNRPLSEMFLVGFDCQLRDLYLKTEERAAAPELTPLSLPTNRDSLYGCLAAVADWFEWKTMSVTDGGVTVSENDGRTNALRSMNALISSPLTVWSYIHNSLIPYFEKAAVKEVCSVQRIIEQIELRFDKTERLSPVPLGSTFVHGYLAMRHALRCNRDFDGDFFNTEIGAIEPTDRDSAFAALFALENFTERRALSGIEPEKDRLSNALRLLPHAAVCPNKTKEHLMRCMTVYLKKLRFNSKITEERDKLLQFIENKGWNIDTPLGAGYLHIYYLYTALYRKD